MALVAAAASAAAVATAPISLWSKQTEVFDAVQGEAPKHVCAIWGRGAGKSVVARAVALNAASRERRQLVVIVAPSWIQGRSIHWRELRAQVPKNFLGAGNAINEQRMEIRLRNDSEIWVRGSDNLDGLRGTTINRLVLDEYQDQRPETFQVLSGNLRTSDNRMLVLGTPNGPDHFQDLFNRAAKDPEWLVLRAPTWASPYADLRHLRAMQRVMDRHWWAQEFGAEFISVSGAIYKDFSRDTHVAPTVPNMQARFWVGADFNAANYCAVIGQANGSGIDVLGEVITKDSIYAHSRNLARWFEARGIDRRQVTVYGDASGMWNSTNSRTAGQSDSIIMQRDGWDLHSERHNPAVLERVHSVQALLLAADGTVRLRVDPSCETLIKCLEGQTWNRYGQPDKSKGLDHAPDALGYMVWALHPIRATREIRVS